MSQGSVRSVDLYVQVDVVDDTTPQLGGHLDVNGFPLGDGTLELLAFTETASAVNHLNITNAITATGPTLSAVGDDTDIDLNLAAKGTGNITVGNFSFDADQTVGVGEDNYVLTYDNGTGLISLEAAAGGGGGLFTEDADDNILGGTGAGANFTAASATFNFVAGIDAGAAVTTGDYNVAVGYQALYDATAAATGSDNVAIGRLAMGSSALTSGHTNIAIGLNALDAASTAFENIAIGKNAMGVATGPNNCIAIGLNAGAGLSVGSDVIAIGIDARSSGNSSDSVAIGAEALLSGTGAGNVGVGASALRIATGSGNVGVGRSSGQNIGTGTDNVFVGEACGSSFGAASTTNVVIGHEGGGNVTGTSSGNVMIGNFAGPSTASVITNELFIDNQQRDEPFLGGDFSTLSLTMKGSLRLTERADHILTPTATFGELWMRDDAPTNLMFTDDAGNDWVLNSDGRTSTTTNLADITHAVNTGDQKVAGHCVFNTTTSQPVWSVGAADGSVWVDATGATAHTPV